MLSSLVKEHQARQQVRKEQQEIKRKEALTAANNLTTALVDHLNVGVAQVWGTLCQPYRNAYCLF